MVSRDGGKVVLWPCYFNSRLTRAQGRRVPTEHSVQGPDVAWIASAAKKAGYEVEVEESVKHPSRPFEVSGRVLIPKSSSKEAIIKAVAAGMAKND
jgi:signal recognition particle subunit SRP19